MSTPRTPKNSGAMLLIAGATIAVMVLAWLLANVVYGLLQVHDALMALIFGN
jgi:hypothetical protein